MLPQYILRWRIPKVFGRRLERFGPSLSPDALLVTEPAKQAAQQPCLVIVVYLQATVRRGLLADGADPGLVVEHQLVLRFRDSVRAAQVARSG